MLRPVKHLEVMGAKLHFRQKRESVFEIDIIFGTTGTLVVEGAQSIPVLTYNDRCSCSNHRNVEVWYPIGIYLGLYSTVEAFLAV